MFQKETKTSYLLMVIGTYWSFHLTPSHISGYKITIQLFQGLYISKTLLLEVKLFDLLNSKENVWLKHLDFISSRMTFF